MDVRLAGYFLAVVDAGTVHGAAAALLVAQPSVSQALRRLERDLGAELFLRTGRRLVLTAAGRALVEPARDLLRARDAARDAVATSSPFFSSNTPTSRTSTPAAGTGLPTTNRAAEVLSATTSAIVKR